MAKLFALCLTGLFAGASAGACDPVDQCQQLSDGDYCPVNNVQEHANINKDVKEIYDLLSADDYIAAKGVYTTGMYSKKDPLRKLQSLAVKDMNKDGSIQNIWYNGYVDLYGTYADVWDPFIVDCFDGAGVCTNRSDAFRKYIINKCLIGVVTGYVAYEMGSGILDKAALQNKVTDGGAAYAWDEAAAFYIGNIPCANTGATASATCKLYSPYEFAWKRDSDYPDGVNVHTAIVKLFNFGLLNLRGSAYNAANVLAAEKEIYKLLAITAIRSAIKYSHKAADDIKYLAEGWAYWRSASGYISSISAATKATVEEIDALFALDQTSVPAETHCQVKQKVESMYAALEIDCSIVGTWTSDTGTCASCDITGATPVHAGSSDYVDMCKAPVDGSSESDTSSAGHPVQITFLGAALSLLASVGF